VRYTATDIIVGIIFTWGVCLIWPLLVRFAIVKKPITKSLSVCLSVLFLLVNLVIAYCLGSTNKTHLPLFLVAFISYAIMHKGYYKKGSDIIVRKEKLKSETEKRNEDIPETTKTPQDNDGGSVTTSTVTTPLAVGAEQKKTTTVENSPPVETSSELRIVLAIVAVIVLIGFILMLHTYTISSKFGGPQNCYSQSVANTNRGMFIDLLTPSQRLSGLWRDMDSGSYMYFSSTDPQLRIGTFRLCNPGSNGFCKPMRFQVLREDKQGQELIIRVHRPLGELEASLGIDLTESDRRCLISKDGQFMSQEYYFCGPNPIFSVYEYVGDQMDATLKRLLDQDKVYEY